MPELAFSVVVPAYNAGAFIAEALVSILEDQPSYAYEVIVVDDGSTDDTASVVRGFGDRIKLVLKSQAGPGSARNVGASEAKSDLVFFLDADDRSLAGRFQAQATYMISHEDVVFSFGNVVYQDRPDYNRHAAWHLPDGQGDFCVVDRPLERLVVQGCYPLTTTVAVRRGAYLGVGGQREDIRVCEDYDCWCKLARVGSVACSSEKFAWVRRGGAHRHLTNSRYVYTDPPRALKGILERYREDIAGDAYAMGVRRFIWSSQMMFRYLWIEDGSEAVYAACRDLSPLLPERVAARWRLLSHFPSWIPRGARNLIRRTRSK